MGMRVQRRTTDALPSGKRPVTHCTGVWVGPWAGLDDCPKSRPPPQTGVDEVLHTNP